MSAPDPSQRLRALGPAALAAGLWLSDPAGSGAVYLLGLLSALLLVPLLAWALRALAAARLPGAWAPRACAPEAVLSGGFWLRGAALPLLARVPVVPLVFTATYLLWCLGWARGDAAAGRLPLLALLVLLLLHCALAEQADAAGCADAAALAALAALAASAYALCVRAWGPARLRFFQTAADRAGGDCPRGR